MAGKTGARREVALRLAGGGKGKGAKVERDHTSFGAQIRLTSGRPLSALQRQWGPADWTKPTGQSLCKRGSGVVQFGCVSERWRSRTRSRWLAQAEPQSARVQSDDQIFRSHRASWSPRSLADLASSNSSRRPSKRAARASGSTKYTKRKISSDASSSSLGNCGSPTSIATSMTPRLPGALDRLVENAPACPGHWRHIC